MATNHLEWQQILSLLFSDNIADFTTASLISFVLIAAAEIGNKDQLVCMTLAARHRTLPIILGAIAAFTLLLPLYSKNG